MLLSAPLRSFIFYRSRLFVLSVPYQDNSWDCGVFVCRYAFAVLQLRERDFNREDPWFQTNLIDSCEEFEFGMPDIKRLREEIMMLVENLSELYLPWKEAQQMQAKEARKERST